MENTSAEAMQKLQEELQQAKQAAEEAKAEAARLKEAEAVLKKQLETSAQKKASGSRIPPGTPFSDVIKQLDFSTFSSAGSKGTKGDPLNVDGDPENNAAGGDGDPKTPEGISTGQVMQYMMMEMQKLSELVRKVPGLPPPIEVAAPGSYADSPFDDCIAMVEMPKKYSAPNLKLYDGTADPLEHVAQYRQRMFNVP